MTKSLGSTLISCAFSGNLGRETIAATTWEKHYLFCAPWENDAPSVQPPTYYFPLPEGYGQSYRLEAVQAGIHTAYSTAFGLGAGDECGHFWEIWSVDAPLSPNPATMRSVGGTRVAWGSFGGGPVEHDVYLQPGHNLWCCVLYKTLGSRGSDLWLFQGTVDLTIRRVAEEEARGEGDVMTPDDSGY